ncbi:hypothetical protein C8J43_11067 [Sphingomonas sp. PP-CE-1G-424]|nr:hypothetical protein C8J43_11067 [Sphingomonas sp. PP-CE-1G-424]
MLHDAASATGFTNLRTGRRGDNKNALLAAILANATNLELARMAAASGRGAVATSWSRRRIRMFGRTIITARLPPSSTRIIGYQPAQQEKGTTASLDGQFLWRQADGSRRYQRAVRRRSRIQLLHPCLRSACPYSVTVISTATHEAVLSTRWHPPSRLVAEVTGIKTRPTSPIRKSAASNGPCSCPICWKTPICADDSKPV